jgi:hypothetical protein
VNSIALEDAIRTRIVQSATAATVQIQGCWSTIAPEGIEPKQGNDPYVVFELLSGLFDDTMTDNGLVMQYRVSIYDHRGNGTTNAKPLYDAVIGNGDPETPPTRGLHRWAATVSGQEITQARLVRVGYGHTGDILHYYLDFEVYAKEA